MTTVVPSCAGSLVMIDVGNVMSRDCGIDAEDVAMPFNKNTRMIVIMSSIAVMLRKLISGARSFRRRARRISIFTLTMLAGFCRGTVAWTVIAVPRNGPRERALRLLWSAGARRSRE